MDGEVLLLVAEFSRDVAVLQWPQQAGERQTLEGLGLPRLLVLDASCEVPPLSSQCLEDWTRVPVEPRDLRARLETLAARSKVHCSAPRIDRVGQLWYRGARIRLSPTEERLAEVLLDRFGAIVSDDDLLDAGWDQTDASRGALRIQLTRLRRRLRPLGLEITSRRGVGHVMNDAGTGTAMVLT